MNKFKTRIPHFNSEHFHKNTEGEDSEDEMKTNAAQVRENDKQEKEGGSDKRVHVNVNMYPTCEPQIPHCN